MYKESSLLACPEKPVPIEDVEMPEKIRSIIRSRYTHLTPPQAEAIRRGLFSSRNMIIATPTASGKTLIAYISLLNSFMNGFKSIYTTPLKALASEKYEELRDLAREIGASVGISTGDYDSPGEELRRYDILVTTYERLDSILRLRPSWFKDVKTIVIDEIHEIGDGDRGPVIEMIIARAVRLDKQIIGLSATIGNPDEIGRWIDAEVVKCSWRPVPLIEGYYDKRRNKIIFVDGREEDVLGDLVSHSVSKAFRENYQLLIFKQSRRESESLATRIASEMGLLSTRISRKDISIVLEELEQKVSSRYEREVLKKLFVRGVSFHHAGLSPEARKVIEKGFREGVLKIIVATPTLAAGVNLPARRVIVFTRRYERGFYEPISVMEYKQMGGRAGRPQYDPYGEVIIADLDPDTAVRYIRSEPEDVVSMLNNERSLRIHVLSLLASRYASTMEGLIDVFMKTFYSYKNIRGLEVRDFWRNTFKRILRTLEDFGVVRVKEDRIHVSRLGELISSLYIDPLTAIRALELISEVEDRTPEDLYYLHVITLTPDFQRSISRRIKRKEVLERLSEKIERGEAPPIPDDLDEEMYITGYLYAEALQRWIEEEDEDKIMSETGLPLGDLRVAVETATWIAYALSKVFEEKRMTEHMRRMSVISRRLEAGVREELLELVTLRGIGRVRARALYKAGVRSIKDLKMLSLDQILSIESINRGVVRELCEQISDAAFCTRSGF
ncbi:MAG: DEAD/DEAH box helicase [Sulfolobales archaeon]